MEQTIGASEFKAKCLDILKRLGEHKLDRVTVTLRGKPVAVMTPHVDETSGIASAIGSMRGSVTAPPDFDWTAPVLDEPLDADQGILHG